MHKRFFIVGAQRSGTTYLYHQLNQHPNIEMATPVRPEPKFFLSDSLYRRGMGYYDTHFFSGKPGAWLRGEKSASYIETEISARRIARHFPDAKIIFALRDPIERAVSNYWFSVANQTENWPLEEAFFKEDERRDDFDPAQISVSPYSYLRRGRYIDYLLMYERYFPRQNMLVLIYEQFVGNVQVIKQLYHFLGVQADFVPATMDQVVNAVPKEPTNLSSALQAYLHAYFAEPNGRLAAYLGQDLTTVWPSARPLPDFINSVAPPAAKM